MSKHKFKVGDFVICINQSGYNLIKEDEIYEVIAFRENRIYLKNKQCSYPVESFRLVAEKITTLEVGDIVTYIPTSTVKYATLEEGKKYKIRKMVGDWCYFQDISYGFNNTSCFSFSHKSPYLEEIKGTVEIGDFVKIEASDFEYDKQFAVVTEKDNNLLKVSFFWDDKTLNIWIREDKVVRIKEVPKLKEVNITIDNLPPFEKGDKVVCVDASGSTLLEEGRIYTVEWASKDNNRIKLQGLGPYLLCTRFRLVNDRKLINVKSDKSNENVNTKEAIKVQGLPGKIKRGKEFRRGGIRSECQVPGIAVSHIRNKFKAVKA